MTRNLNRRFSDDHFDRNFNRAFKGVIVVWAIGVLASLGVLGVIIWAVISVVNHVTSS